MNQRIHRCVHRRFVGFLLAALLLSAPVHGLELPAAGSAAYRGFLAKANIGSTIRTGSTLNQDEAAMRLYYLNILNGSGTDKDGSITFDLQRDLTKLEAAVFAVRLLGMEENVLSIHYPHPFTDVPEWAGSYVGYLYGCGLVENSADGLFSPSAPADLNHFLSYIFYALGYRIESGDYNLLTVAMQAANAGIYTADPEEPLTRGGAVLAMYNTLRANENGVTRMLSERLVTEGKLSYTDAVFLLWSNNPEETQTYLDAVGYTSEWIVPNGYYTIYSAVDNDQVINVLADGPNRDYEGLGVTLWANTGDISQSFRLERTARDTYLVYASCSRGGFHRLLGLANNGRDIGLYLPTSRNALEFSIRHEADGIWRFVTESAQGERYLSVGSTQSRRLVLTEDAADPGTLWSLERLGITNSTGQDLALFPADSMRITQGAYDTYSHMRQNALDMQPTNSMAFAPFNAKIVALSPGYVTCNGVWIESVEKVRYADGSFDYMTVLFMHDDNISNLSVGQMLTQGEYFYQSGTTGNSSGAHIHLAVYRGQYDPESMVLGSGDVYAQDAFYVLDDTVIRDDYGILWKSVSEAE